MKKLLTILNLFFILALIISCAVTKSGMSILPTTDDSTYFILPETDLKAGAHHVQHEKIFGKNVSGINHAILQGIDIVQAHTMDGGSYFTGKDSIPTESPVYYDLQLFGKPLIKAPRHASYCSGATYSAFIEALNLLLPDGGKMLSPPRLEAIRMQEPDGGRREDLIKFWGYWNADGFGTHFALVQYARMGQEIRPAQLRPGDFVNISWKTGLGHSVIFLGWVLQEGDKKMLYWSSQRATNGYGDQLVSLDRIKEIKAVRLTNLQQLFGFNIDEPVSLQIPGNLIDW